MSEPDPSTTDSHNAESRAAEADVEIRERAQNLQRKLSDLSKTFDHIEQELAEAADESDKKSG